MGDDFSNKVKGIEKEILALKTSSLYTSIRNTVTAYSGTVSTGVYRIEYDNGGEKIISEVYTNQYKKIYGNVFLRTPQDSFQLAEVDTTDKATGETHSTSFVVVSNVQVLSITRIS